MCLAVPMRVKKLLNITGAECAHANDLPVTAIVEVNGVEQGVRLDIVDILPKEGDYVIVHAGFAIRTLPPEDALKDLELIRQALERSSA
ncbi:MAG: HypC/HybG/HupF family hydrogenase formation chaperone [Deltaproteobacteria bacterium]|jgi:hydrogenase expression/formation protein HypC|nr:HypC/HybG/HupF family hydrogenase formation chaperone [Deltaproteobacteria bacterium]